MITVMLILGSCHTPKNVREAGDAVDAIDTENTTDTQTESAAPTEREMSAPEAVTQTQQKEIVETPSVNQTTLMAFPDIDEMPTTPQASAEDMALAARIAKFKRTKDRGVWWECGKRHELEEFDVAALEWASAINKAYHNTSYKLRSGKVVKVNRAEALGIMMRETRLDRCAVGPYPRIFAYKNNIIKKKKGILSHTMPEIKKVFTHWRFQGRLADIGPGQIVKRIGRGKEHLKWEEVQDFLSLEPGIQLLFDEMADRGRMYSTRTPSISWPGSGDNSWYTLSVLRIGGKITGKPQNFRIKVSKRRKQMSARKKPTYIRVNKLKSRS
jgi:hypothetical protein